jgi:hypothetical protein
MGAKMDMSEEEYSEHWKNLPESDRRFIVTMLELTDLLGDRGLRFCEITPEVARVLEQADRDMLMTITGLCVGILAQSPVIERLTRDYAHAGALIRARIRPQHGMDKDRKPGR